MIRRILAEFLGTFALVFFGAGSAAIGYGGLTGVALTHGFILFIFISFFAGISGAHFNPAVTFAMWVRKRIPSADAARYVLVQFAAGLTAAGMLGILLVGTCIDLGSTRLGETVLPWQGFLLETLLTFFLVLSIFRAQRLGESSLTPAFIGLMLTCSIIMAGLLTGASLNPARSLGPNLLSYATSDLWIYLTAPFLGGALAALADRWYSSLQD